jgi:hypothetical protein
MHFLLRDLKPTSVSAVRSSSAGCAPMHLHAAGVAGVASGGHERDPCGFCGALVWRSLVLLARPRAVSRIRYTDRMTVPIDVTASVLRNTRLSSDYHVILLEDTRDATPPAMDELKPQIAQMLQSKVVKDYLEKLKSGAKIEVTEIQVQVKPMPEAAKDSKSEKK